MIDMKKRTKILLVLILVLVTLTAVGTIVAINLKPEPPVLLMEDARKSLLEAREKQADVYASELFSKAQNYYDSAMNLWQIENDRFFLKRDFSKVAYLAALSSEFSKKSVEEAQVQSSSVKNRTNKKFSELEKLIQEINILERFPLPLSITHILSKGRMLLTEAKVLHDKEFFIQAEQKALESEKLIKTAHEQAFKIINDYFENYNLWKSWKEQTIENSRKNKNVAILVDKFAGKCYVYKNGKLTHEFDAELGKNWIGDKNRKGDRTTPEGLYHIKEKKQGSRTIYYKALLINYPNDEDKRRFQAALKNGTIPKHSKIGGMIEIHGHGGKGTDWTDGCVALTNRDMDIIYPLVEIGTPVTIIGSSKPLHEILNSKNE